MTSYRLDEKGGHNLVLDTG